MARPRKNAKAETPAAPPAAPAAGVFGGAAPAAAPAANAFAPAPSVPQGQVTQPNVFGGNPAPAAFTAAQAAHPTANAAIQAPAVDPNKETNAKIDALAKTVASYGDGFKNILQAIAALEGKLSAVTPSAPSAPIQAAPAVASVPTPPVAAAPAAAPAAPGFDPQQVAHVVTYIRSVLSQHYGSQGAAITVNDPNHQVMLVNAALASGAPYLQGADPNNADLRAHLVQSLQQAGAVDANGVVQP